MTKKQAEETKNFLIYMHLILMAREETLSAEGYIALSELRKQYPQFKNMHKENDKIFKWLNAEEEQSKHEKAAA